MKLTMMPTFLILLASADSVLCQTTSFTTTYEFCETSYQITPTSPVKTSVLTTDVTVTSRTTYTSQTTTYTVALGVPKKVTAYTYTAATVSVTAPTQTRTSTVTATAAPKLTTVTPAATTVSSTTTIIVAGPVSTTTIQPAPITISSNALVTASGMTVTETTTTSLNARRKEKRALYPVSNEEHGAPAIERRAGGYPKSVFCVVQHYTQTIISTTTYLHSVITHVSSTVTSTSTVTQTVALTTTPTTVVSRTITSSPALSTINAPAPIITKTISVSRTASGSLVSVTASGTTTTVVISSTITPAPTTVTITVTSTLQSSSYSPTSSLPSSTAAPAETCRTPLITDNADCPTITGDGVGEQYYVFYTGTRFIENQNNAGNYFPQIYPPVTTTYPCTLDACSALTACTNDAYDQNGYFQFDLHFLNSTQMWECVQYFDNQATVADFNVVNEDAVVTYGYRCDGGGCN